MSAKTNAVVAVRKSSPTGTAVFLVDAVVGPLCCMVGSVTVGTSNLSGAFGIGFTLYLVDGTALPLTQGHSISRMRYITLMTTFPRAWPSVMYRMASGVSLSG